MDHRGLTSRLMFESRPDAERGRWTSAVVRMRGLLVLAGVLICGCGVAVTPAKAGTQHSVARQWNELLMESIRNDFARPTVHARNLWHIAIAMWDSWAVYDADAFPYMTHEHRFAADVEAAREETLSFAVYRLLVHRFTGSPGAALMLPQYDALMDDLGYDRQFTTTFGNSPAAVGNRIAANIIEFGLHDGSNEQNGYANIFYEPENEALVPPLPGNPSITDPNRWQPLALEFFEDQSGNIIPFGYPDALSPEWGYVKAFALRPQDLSITARDGFFWWVYHDPGPPPLMGFGSDDAYRATFEKVIEYSSKLDPISGVMIDISPVTRGHSTVGTNDGTGYELNPITGQPYTPEIVDEGDYYRILAEFWADGPNSETPPGHWHVIANYVSDVIAEKRIGGEGPIVNDLEWDVKIYFAMAGAVHDAAVSSWGAKGRYDFIRPISAIRYMGDKGQCSDPFGPSYHPRGLSLHPGLIEVITPESCAPGERHQHLDDHIGEMAIYAWRGPEYINDPEVDTAGVGWILAANWWPYQRPSFVTPPFPGYVSGHSTFSRSAAELMSRFTGSEFFPGGLGEFFCPENEFLVFEEGPTMDITLQWAKYGDAADECSLSRIYGGIHPPADDIPGRLMGEEIGPDAWELARDYFNGTVYEQFEECFHGPLDTTLPAECLRSDKDGDGDVDLFDYALMQEAAGR